MNKMIYRNSNMDCIIKEADTGLYILFLDLVIIPKTSLQEAIAYIDKYYSELEEFFKSKKRTV